MTAFETIRLVAGREIRERVRSKAFLASAAFTLLLVLGAAIVPGLIGDDGPKRYQVGVLGDGSRAVADRLPATAEAMGEDVTFELRPVADDAEASALVRAGEVDVVLAGSEVVVSEELDDRLGTLLQAAHREVASEAALARAGVSGSAAATAVRPPPLAVRALDPPDEADGERQGVVFVGTMLLYGQLLGFGYYVANGILEEKASRVIEVVLAKARPSHVLTGKILGIGILGFTQLVGTVVVGLVAASVAGSIDLPASIIRLAVEVVAWFVLGYALYASLYAVGGALASRTEELQNTTAPITMVAVFSFIASTSAVGDPGGTLARIATFVPVTAPMLLPIRTSAGEIALWEVALSVTMVLLATLGAVLLAGKVYAGSALQVRGQVKLRAALGRAR